MASPWTAVHRSSISWPKHWRKYIGKIVRVEGTTGQVKYRVYPLRTNTPEYGAEMRAFCHDKPGALPAPFDEPIEFDTPDDIDAWATLAAKLEK